MNYLYILASLPFLIYGILNLKKQLHMIQQNSYMCDRYLRWLKTKYKPDFRQLLPIIAVGGFLIGGIGDYVALVIWFFGYMIMIFSSKEEPSKKALVFTKRAIRLFVMSIALFVIPSFCIIFFLMTKAPIIFCIILVVFVFAAPVFMNLANAIMTPFENKGKEKFLNEAKGMLASATDLKKVAITGSYGKTSVKHIVNGILSEKYETLMPPGSYNTPMGITKIVRENLKPYHQFFVTEMGAKQIGDIKELCDLVAPDYGLITAIGQQHLETFGSFENIVNTKCELLDELPENGMAVLNFDDENIYANRTRFKGKVISYGIHSDNLDYRAVNIEYHSCGTDFEIEAPGGEKVEIRTKLLGEHNIYNITGAVALSHELGVSFVECRRAIANLQPIEHRLELKHTQNGLFIIDDAFNANPAGAKAGMEVLRRMTGGKKYLITPGMVELGEKEYEENKKFGMEAAAACDYVALVGIKQTAPIKEGLLEAGFPEENIFCAANLKEANAFVYGRTVAGDIVMYENDLPDTYNE